MPDQRPQQDTYGILWTQVDYPPASFLRALGELFHKYGFAIAPSTSDKERPIVASLIHHGKIESLEDILAPKEYLRLASKKRGKRVMQHHMSVSLDSVLSSFSRFSHFSM
ncbi:MAG: hypothetical protein IKG21_08355 [Atopobiaceae bacterium]|nr:hypothetical protein [Atopobiaceae bacterium]